MEAMIDFARGPLFVGAFSFMVLGYIRHVALTLMEVKRALNRAGDKTLPGKLIWRATLKWLNPLGDLKNRLMMRIFSVLFHISILIVPLFLAGHIVLWTRGTGLHWPAIPNEAADLLTIVAMVTAVILVVQRTLSRATRALSRFQDYALPLIVALPFASGFLLMHPFVNPFSFESTLLVHIMSANLVFVLMPTTKLSHAVLLPSVQLVSEVGWHWPKESGSRVGIDLNKEGEPV